MAVIQDLGVLGNDIYQPKLKNKWRLFMLGSNSTAVTSNVISASRPKLEFDPVELHAYNSRAYVAGKHSFQPSQISIRDDLGGQVERFIRDQLEKQQKIVGVGSANILPTAQGGSDYKFAMHLRAMDGNEGVMDNWVHQGCWIMNADFSEFEYQNSDQVVISLTIRFDHAYLDISGVNKMATGGA